MSALNIPSKDILKKKIHKSSRKINIFRWSYNLSLKDIAKLLKND